MRPHTRSNPAGGTGASDVRRLLRKLRDANLRASSRGPRELRIEGCLSLDRPVEDSVRYSVRIDGESFELDIRPGPGSIELVFAREQPEEQRVSQHALSREGNGHVHLEGVGELDLDENRPEEIERCLLELVREASSRRRAG